MRMIHSIKNGSSHFSKITIAIAAIVLVSCSEGDSTELIAIKEGQTFQEAMEIRYPTDESFVDENAEELDGGENEEVASEISTMILSKHLQTRIRNVALTTIMPVEVENLRGWKYQTNYSKG